VWCGGAVVRQDGDVGLIATADDQRDWRPRCSCRPGSAAPCCSDTGELSSRVMHMCAYAQPSSIFSPLCFTCVNFGLF